MKNKTRPRLIEVIKELQSKLEDADSYIMRLESANIKYGDSISELQKANKELGEENTKHVKNVNTATSIIGRLVIELEQKPVKYEVSATSELSHDIFF